MEIRICGHRKAVEILQESPKQLDVIFISGPDQRFAVNGSYMIPELAKECCEILYHDVTQARAHLEPPQPYHVKKALEFAKGRGKLLVCCQAGISRSSATAYVVQTAEVGPMEALKVLNHKIHSPNKLVVAHGANILGLPEMVELITAWQQKADEEQMHDGPSLF